MRSSFFTSLLALNASIVTAQFPTKPDGLTVVRSEVDSDVTISFKETTICPQPMGSKTYSGFVHLPGSSLVDIGGYDINTYFVYFEARNKPSTAPLVIYLAGGPGESSLYTALDGENGPCYVNVQADGTVRSEWSFNENANILYIDQPVMAGFSYSSLINGTFDLLDQGLITPLSEQSPPPQVNATFGYGTFPSQKFQLTANTTVQAGKALWHFSENWLSSFPGYRTASNKISIWGNSYGGFWVPETAALLSKGLKNLSSDHPLKPLCLRIDTIGLTNSCIDFQSQITGWPQYAYNNTYGVRFASESQYKAALHSLNKPGGCNDLIGQCRTLGEISDPDFTGSNSTVNELCMAAFGYCAKHAVLAFQRLNKRDAFDIAMPANTPCPWYLPVSNYLNSGTVQSELGVPLNFTYDSAVVTTNFGLPSPYTKRPIAKQTGDSVRQNGLPDIEYLLANGVKVAFVYGDRDYRCPWTGGQATALAAQWTGRIDFASAGYEELQGISERGLDHGGVVKQAGLLSFTRVFDAGHSVSAYAPETVLRIFERTILGLDVASGTRKAGSGYRSQGPTESWSWRNTLPQTVPQTCVVNGRFQNVNPWAAVLGGSG